MAALFAAPLVQEEVAGHDVYFDFLMPWLLLFAMVARWMGTYSHVSPNPASISSPVYRHLYLGCWISLVLFTRCIQAGAYVVHINEVGECSASTATTVALMLTLASDFSLLALFCNPVYISKQYIPLFISMSYVLWAFTFAAGIVFSVNGAMIVMGLLVATLQTIDSAFLIHRFQTWSGVEFPKPNQS